MKKIIIFFLIISTYKVSTNLYYFFRIRHLSQMHLECLSDRAPNFPTYKAEIISLFKKAGVKNISIPITQSVGFGRAATFEADVFTNFPSAHSDISGGAVRMFYEAEGIFRQRIFETFSPVFWINSVVFAPKKLLEYLGFDENKSLFKACNVLLTFIWWVFGITIMFFLPKLKEIIIELSGKL